MTKWIYNESKHCGIDYSDQRQAEEYDSLHQTFRNYEKEYGERAEEMAKNATYF